MREVWAFAIAVAIIVAFVVFVERSFGQDRLPGIQAVVFSERMPGPGAKMLEPHDAPNGDGTVTLPKVTSPNLFNCRSGKFDCDADMCVWACEIEKTNPDDDITYPLNKEEEDEYGAGSCRVEGDLLICDNTTTPLPDLDFEGKTEVEPCKEIEKGDCGDGI